MRAEPDAVDVRGKLFVIAAPSGAGKTSLVKALMEQMSDAVSRVIDVMNNQIDTTANVIRHMRPQTG